MSSRGPIPACFTRVLILLLPLDLGRYGLLEEAAYFSRRSGVPDWRLFFEA